MDVYGKVRDATDGTPLPGAKVSLYIAGEELAVITSNEKGEFTHSREASYIGEIMTCQVEKEEYQMKEITHKIEQDEVRLEIDLGHVPVEKNIESRFSIKDEKNSPLVGVNITLEIENEQVGTGLSNEAGLFETTLRPGLEGKTLSYKAELAEYEVAKGQIKLEKNIYCQVTMKRKSRPRFGKIWFWIGGFIAIETIFLGLVGGHEGVTTFLINNIILIPVTTFVLAFIRPINWKHAVLYVVVLQIIAIWGVFFGLFQSRRHSDSDVSAAILLTSLTLIVNSVLCGLISFFRLRRITRRQAEE